MEISIRQLHAFVAVAKLRSDPHPEELARQASRRIAARSWFETRRLAALL
jgi:hypothetical protein